MVDDSPLLLPGLVAGPLDVLGTREYGPFFCADADPFPKFDHHNHQMAPLASTLSAVAGYAHQMKASSSPLPPTGGTQGRIRRRQLLAANSTTANRGARYGGDHRSLGVEWR